ncbi:MAG: right-handed parallel beta-helix repeat-containing protein [Aureliella sp.]
MNATVWLAVVLWAIVASSGGDSAGWACAAEFFATPGGQPSGDGSRGSPWDLATGLSQQAKLSPGDTLWLAGGTYRGGFTSQLTGVPGRPIVVRGMPGERVTIDAAPRDQGDDGRLLLRGADVIYRDFEFMCSDAKRTTSLSGSWPADMRRGSIDVRGTRISLVNLNVHDAAYGVGFWADGEGGEISGCLIYNNGWQGPDRPHGHGVYAQNALGTKRIVDNIVFHQFDYGLHVYGSQQASLKGFAIEGNILFDNGCWSGGESGQPAILVGGGSTAARISLRDNVAIGGLVRLGYPWGATNQDTTVTHNVFLGGFVLRDFRQAVIKHNVFSAHSTVVALEGAGTVVTSGLDWDENELHVTDGRWGETAIVEKGKSCALDFRAWQNATHCDAHSTFSASAPSTLRVIVRPNPHEQGRGHIAVINPQGLPAVEVDLSPVLQPGQAYRIVNAKNFYGAAVAEGIFAGRPVRLSLQPVDAPRPVGWSGAAVKSREPAFAAFVVLPKQ